MTARPPLPLWDTLALRPYLAALANRFAYLEVLAMPKLRDLPTRLSLNTQFVQPFLAQQAADINLDPKKWPEGLAVFSALQKHSQIIALGDPGCGKTTMLAWLAWRLSAGLAKPLPDYMQDRLPLCAVLRDLGEEYFHADVDVATLGQMLARRLLGAGWDKDEEGKQALQAFITGGQYLLLLDGADEIGHARQNQVRRWLQEAHQAGGMALATARVVGYEENPLECPPERMNPEPQAQKVHPVHQGRHTGQDAAPEAGQGWAQRLYVLPFNDQQIQAFAQGWYQQRLGNAEEAQAQAADFFRAVYQSQDTRKLARTPNLLGMMAVVHRERAVLPSGRALLYKEIANAYINTIDQQRKISAGDVLSRYPSEVREAWIAALGFHAQQQRGWEDGSVLLRKDQVLAWLTVAMQASQMPDAALHAEEFLQWVARRSGLLLPRSEEYYAFAHLSFQEYFCARYLLEQVTSPAFLRGKATVVSAASLKKWGEAPRWAESLLFLLELLANERGGEWLEEVLQALFGEVGSEQDFGLGQVQFAVKVMLDQQIFLTQERKTQLAFGMAWRVSRRDREVRSALYASGHGWNGEAESFSAAQLHPEKILAVWGQEKFDLRHLQQFSALRALNLSDAQIENWQAWPQLASLRYLNLTAASGIGKLSVLAAKLPQLVRLDLMRTEIEDFENLAGLRALKSLYIGHTRLQDLACLSKLENLRLLNLDNTRVRDLSALATLQNLKILALRGTPLKSLQALSGLPKLQEVWLSESQRALLEALPATDRAALKPKLEFF